MVSTETLVITSLGDQTQHFKTLRDTSTGLENAGTAWE